MRKLLALSLVVMVVGLVSLAAAARGVSALVIWCWSDPVVAVNGRQLSVDIGVPQENLANITGTVVTEVTVPEGVTVDVLNVDTTYFNEAVEIRYDSGLQETSDGGIPVRVKVIMPVDAVFQVAITLTHGGVSDTTIRVSESTFVGRAILY